MGTSPISRRLFSAALLLTAVKPASALELMCEVSNEDSVHYKTITVDHSTAPVDVDDMHELARSAHQDNLAISELFSIEPKNYLLQVGWMGRYHAKPAVLGSECPIIFVPYNQWLDGNRPIFHEMSHHVLGLGSGVDAMHHEGLPSLLQAKHGITRGFPNQNESLAPTLAELLDKKDMGLPPLEGIENLFFNRDWRMRQIGMLVSACFLDYVGNLPGVELSHLIALYRTGEYAKIVGKSRDQVERGFRESFHNYFREWRTNHSRAPYLGQPRNLPV